MGISTVAGVGEVVVIQSQVFPRVPPLAGELLTQVWEYSEAGIPMQLITEFVGAGSWRNADVERTRRYLVLPAYRLNGDIEPTEFRLLFPMPMPMVRMQNALMRVDATDPNHWDMSTAVIVPNFMNIAAAEVDAKYFESIRTDFDN